MKNIQINKSYLELVVGDITEQGTDAIVNAANTGLRGGGGVDGAIHRAGGPEILKDCEKIGGCPTGEARITAGGRLKAAHVIHAVAPFYGDGTRREADLLAGAYRSSLELASRHNIRSIAFPSLGTGAYRYPVPRAARIALATVMEYLQDHPEIELARFVLFSENDFTAYAEALGELSATRDATNHTRHGGNS
jgi:O-acetyl-ADP-ribose deacetylase